MPIYAYRCESCGFDKDVLQKMSDAPLTQCPSCGADTFRKQVTAAGFQLKGSGWYVTDFRGGNSGNGGKSGGAEAGAKAAGENASSGEGSKPAAESAAGGSGDSGAAASTPASAPASPSTPAAST